MLDDRAGRYKATLPGVRAGQSPGKARPRGRDETARRVGETTGGLRGDLAGPVAWHARRVAVSGDRLTLGS
jgi:hypothetical protein